MFLAGQAAEAQLIAAQSPIVVTLGVTFDHRFMDGYQSGKMADLMRAYMADPEQYEGKLATATPLAIGLNPSR